MEQSFLSSDWRRERLGELADVFAGGTPKTSEPSFWDGGEIVWITPTDLTALRGKLIKDSARKITKDGLAKSSARLAPPGSVLVTSRATIGVPAIAHREVAMNQGVTALVPKDDRVTSEWLYHWCHVARPEMIRRGSGTTFLEISRTKMRDLMVDLPAPAEQRRMVDLLAAADALVERIASELEALERLLGAVTEDLYQDTASKFGVSPLSQLAAVERGCSWSKEDETYSAEDGTVPVVRIGNVQRSGIDMTDTLRIRNVPEAKVKKHAISPDTILIVGSNGNPERVGNAYLATPEVEGHIYASFLIGVRPEKLPARFVWRILQSPTVQRMISSATSGSTGLMNIGLTWLRALEVPAPPQHACARLLELVESVDAARVAVIAELEEAAAMRDSLRLALFERQHVLTEAYDVFLHKAPVGERTAAD